MHAVALLVIEKAVNLRQPDVRLDERRIQFKRRLGGDDSLTKLAELSEDMRITAVVVRAVLIDIQQSLIVSARDLRIVEFVVEPGDRSRGQ